MFKAILILIMVSITTYALAQEFKTYSAEADKLVITEQKVSKTDLAQIDAAIEQAQAELAKYQAICADIQKTIDNGLALKAKAIEVGVTAKTEEIKPE